MSTDHSSTQGLSWGLAPTPWYSQQRVYIPLLFHPQTELFPELFPVLLEVPAAPTALSHAHFLPLAPVGRGGEGMCQPVLSTAFTLTGQHAHTDRQLAVF